MTAERLARGETYAAVCVICGKDFGYVYDRRRRLRCDECRVTPATTRKRGETYVATCGQCHEPFEYVFGSGKFPTRCDACKRRGRPGVCGGCGKEFFHRGTNPMPKQGPCCRARRKSSTQYEREARESRVRLHIIGLRAESVHYRPRATESPSEPPRLRPQRLAAVPQPEPASASSEAVEQTPAPPTGPSSEAAQFRAEVATANARLSETDQRDLVQLIERERQHVQLVRRTGDYDYVLVDGVPAKIRRAAPA